LYIQYQNSIKFVNLLTQLEAYLSIPVRDFYNHFYNLQTCDTQGLNNWGKILNQTRNTLVPDYSQVVGFENGIPPDPIDTGYPQNFNNGNFYGGQTRTVILDDAKYRLLLQLIYQKYSVDCSVAACTNVINYYIQQRYNNPAYYCEIIEGNMEFVYLFSFTPQDWEIALFKYSQVLPKPAGIAYIIQWK